MENTVLKNIISNFDLMANDHFLDWFKENKEVLLEKEKQQIIDAVLYGFKYSGEGYNGEYPFEGSSDADIIESLNPVDYYDTNFKNK